MSIVAPVAEARRRPVDGDGRQGFERLRAVRSDVPAVTHVDYSARLQTVDDARHGRFAALLRTFEAKTGCPVMVNTSFNVRGEPIVRTPDDALRCFMATGMDALVLGRSVLLKERQPEGARVDAEAHLAQLRDGLTPCRTSGSTAIRSPRDLRWFGLLLPIFVALVGAIARWQFGAPAAATGIWSVGGALAALYWLVPPLRRHDPGRLDVCRPAHRLDRLAPGDGRRLLRRRDADRPAVASRPRRHAAPSARPRRAQLLDRAPAPQRLAPLLTAVLIRRRAVSG